MSKSENNRAIIDHNLCTQSETCAAVCPVAAIEIIDGYPKFTKNCEAPCQECFDGCPSEAISMK